MTSKIDVYKERTNLRMIIVSIILAGLGIGLLSISDNGWIKNSSLQLVSKDVGSLLISSVALAALWELAAKRSFVAELMEKAKLAQEVREAGLVSITFDFQHNIDWQHLFKTSSKLDIFFAYAQTWRRIYTSELRALSRRSDARVRVILPDPECAELMKELGRRFSQTEEAVRNLILEATEDFKTMFMDAADVRAEFSLWYLPESPVFSFYRFDTIVILALYKHRKERGNVPTLVLDKGGSISEFVREEFYAFIQGPNPLARKIMTRPKA